MVSAEAVVSVLRDIAIRRSQTAATRRQKKKAESGWVRRRPIVEHPEGIVEEKSGVVDSKEGSSSDSQAGNRCIKHRSWHHNASNLGLWDRLTPYVPFD